MPFPGLRAGSPQHPFTDWHDQAAVLRNSYEFIGRHKAQFRVLPAEERLQPGDPSSGNIHLRLIHEKEFFFVECQSQAVLQGQSLHSLSVHVLREEPKIVTSIIFGAIHGRIGILDQSFAVRTVFRENADAEAATNTERVTLNDEFSGHCIHEPLSGNCCIGDVLYVSQHDKKFVST